MSFIKVHRPDEKILEKIIFSEKDIRISSIPNIFSYYKKKILKKFVENPNCTLYLAEKNNIITCFAFLVSLEWDSGIFGFKMGRIENFKINNVSDESYRLLNSIIKDCKKQQYCHLNCRLGLRDFEELYLFEKSKFNIMDIQLTFSTSECISEINLPDFSANKFEFKKAEIDDLGQLNNIVRDGFTDTRFFRDLRYPRDRVNKLYFEWVKNSILDSQQTCWVVEDKSTKHLMGFVICNFDPDTEATIGTRIGAIDLIVVAKECRNQGIGQMLVGHALNWFKTKADKVEVRTQVSNIPAIRAFMKAGFKEVTSGVMLPAGISLHHWF